MPSVYQSCTIRDEASEALAQLKQHLDEVRTDFDTQMATLAASIADLEGDPVKASVTVGTGVDAQITWTAQETGRAGNQINVTYIYLGPLYDVGTGALVVRWPTAEVDGNTIRLYLASDVNGSIVLSTSWHLFFWLANTDVVALVAGALVGTGADIPEVQQTTYLAGGKDRSVTQVESVANQVAEPFGHKDYRDLLRSIDVPVIETAADAAAFLQEDGKYVIVNNKLLLVSGTNLVALNKLWTIVGNNLTTLRTILAQISSGLPTLVSTQNVTTTTYARVCGVLQPITAITEQYRAVNTNTNTLVVKYGSTLDSFHHYVFWGETVNPSRVAYERVTKWGMPEEYIGDILSGENPTEELYLDVPVPTVFTITQLDLLTALKFTNAEITELLNKNVAGVQIPFQVSVADKAVALRNLLSAKPFIRPNGMKSRVKAPIVALQTLSVSQTMDDNNLTKELATRGKACARSSSRMLAVPDFNIPNLPDLDLPNLPFDKLPDPAKKVESAFGALSAGVSFATKTFDLMLGTLEKTVKGILGKIQSAASLTDNLFGNDLAKCLLGTGTDNTGAPNFSGVGEGLGLNGGNSVPSLNSITGGLPIPKSMLKDFFKKMSIELDETITSGLETAMKSLQIPLCIIQSLLSSLSGFDLGGLLNPCKSGKDANDKCPAEDTQAVVDASTELTGALDTIPSLDDLPTTQAVETVNETVNQFTGTIKKTVESTQDAVTRGIKQVMDDISTSVDSKLEMVDKLDKAIKELFGDVKDIKENIDEDDNKSSGCFPAILGSFTDAITDYI
jgi:hypothetical protein